MTLEPSGSFESRVPELGIQPLTTRIIGKMYVKCQCPLFINIKQILHCKVAIE